MARNTNADFEVLGNLRLEFDEAQVKSVLRSASKMTDKEFQKTAIELGGFFERIMSTGAAQTGIQAKNYIRDLYGLKNLTGKQQALLSSGAAHAMGLRDFGKRKIALDKEKQKDDEKLANQMADGREKAAKKRLDEENKAKQELLKKEQKAKLVAEKEEYQQAKAEVLKEKKDLEVSSDAQGFAKKIQKSLDWFESQKGNKVSESIFNQQKEILDDNITKANNFLSLNKSRAELKELKNLSKLSKKGNDIATKTQKELGIKKPGFFDKIIGGISLGSLGLGALAYKTFSFGKNAVSSYSASVKELRGITNAYGVDFAKEDMKNAKIAAILSGTNESDVLKVATYAADVRGRMMTGKMSDSEAAALGFFSQYANVGFTGKGDAVNALKQDILNLKRSGVDISVIRSLLGDLGLSPELLSIGNKYLSGESEALVRGNVELDTQRRVSSISTQARIEAGESIAKGARDAIVGKPLLSAYDKVLGTVTGIKPNTTTGNTTNNVTINVATVNATTREEGEKSLKTVSNIIVDTIQNASASN